MGEVDNYPSGTFCWIDLGTSDVARAKTFYRGLFGWELEDIPPGESGTYTVCRLHGKEVAAIHERSSAEDAEWSSFISVGDAEGATAKASGLGATVIVEPFDVPDAGRMSVIRDPTGASVHLWERRGLIGARLVNEVGTWSWNELVTRDGEAAKSFYGALFDWTADDIPGPIPRTSFGLGPLLVGGMHAPTEQEDDMSRWTISFTVADANDGAALAERLGGKILLPPMQVPRGSLAIISDPGGASFTLAAVQGGPLRGVDGS